MKLIKENWNAHEASKIPEPLAKHANFIKERLNIEEIAKPDKENNHIKLAEFNKRIVNAIIEEGIKGNLDKAQKILEQKLKVEEASGGKNRLPEKVVSEIIPTIKEYFEENTEKIKQDLSTPEKKQPLAEKLQNIDSTTKAPDIQNSAHLIHEEIKKVFDNQQNTPKKEVSDIIKPSMEKNIPNNSPESNKFLVLEKEAEKIKLYYKNELKREFKNDPNDPVVKAFDENPYLWMQAEIGNGIARLKKATQKAKTGTEKQTLLNKIISLENKIPPINYVLKKEALREIKDGDTLFITENGNTVKYKIVSIDQEKVRFDKEGYPLTMFLSRTAMENFLLNPSVSFKKEKIRPEQKGTEKNNKKNSEKTKTTPPIDKTPDAQTENIDTSNEKPVAVTEDTSEHAMESGGTENEKKLLLDQAKLEYQEEISRIKREFEEKRKKLRESLAVPPVKIGEDKIKLSSQTPTIFELRTQIKNFNQEQKIPKDQLFTLEDIKEGATVYVFNDQIGGYNSEPREPWVIDKIDEEGFILATNKNTGSQKPLGNISDKGADLVHQTNLVKGLL